MTPTRQALVEWIHAVRQQGEGLLRDDLAPSPRSYFERTSSNATTELFNRLERWRQWRLTLVSGLRRRIAHCDHLVSEAERRFADRRLLVFRLVDFNDARKSRTFDLSDRVYLESGDGWLELQEWFQRGRETPTWNAARQSMIAEVNGLATLLLEQIDELELAATGRVEPEVNPDADSVSSAVDEDAVAVLIALAEYARHPADPERGRYFLEGDQLRELTGLDTGRLNDAVAILASDGLVDVHRMMATAPYDFGNVTLTAQGRREAQRRTPRARLAVAPQFDLIEVIGEGTIGKVWRSRDRRLNRDVAIKVVRGNAVGQDALAHARALARVAHLNVVAVYDVTRVIDPDTKSPADAIVMELVEGPTLVERMGRPMPAPEVRRIGSAMLGAIEAYHRAGLAHLDVHDGNIIVGSIVKVLDPIYCETELFRSTAAREKQQARDVRELRDLLIQMLHLGAVPHELAAEFERATTPHPTLHVLRTQLHETLERGASAPSEEPHVTGFLPGPLADVARAIVTALATTKGHGALTLEQLGDETKHAAAQIKDAITVLADAGLVTLDGSSGQAGLTLFGREEAHRLGESLPSPTADYQQLVRFLADSGDGSDRGAAELDEAALLTGLGFDLARLRDAAELIRLNRVGTVRTSRRGDTRVIHVQLNSRGRQLRSRGADASATQSLARNKIVDVVSETYARTRRLHAAATALTQLAQFDGPDEASRRDGEQRREAAFKSAWADLGEYLLVNALFLGTPLESLLAEYMRGIASAVATWSAARGVAGNPMDWVKATNAIKALGETTLIQATGHMRSLVGIEAS